MNNVLTAIQLYTTYLNNNTINNANVCKYKPIEVAVQFQTCINHTKCKLSISNLVTQKPETIAFWVQLGATKGTLM